MSNDVLECEGDATLTINVLGDFNISGDDSICVGDSAHFSATQNNNPFNVDWTCSAGTVLNSPNAAFLFNTPGTYTITATPLPGTACSPFKTLTLVVIAAPPQPSIAGPNLVCPGNQYTYTASGSGNGVTYAWTTTGGITPGSSNSNPFVATVNSSGTITVTPTSTVGCPGPSQTISVNTYTAPAPSIQSDTFTVCPDAKITYTATLSYGGSSSVVWSVIPAAAGTVLSGQGTGTVTIEWHGNISNTIQSPVYLKVVEAICGNLKDSSTAVITINPSPTPNATGASVCYGGSANISVTGGGGSTFNWYTSLGSFVASGSTIPINNPGNYYVEETDVNGCKAKDYVQVNAFPQPIVGISASGPVMCNTNNNTLSSNITLQTFAGSGYTFLWSTVGGAFVDPTNSNPITISSAGSYQVIVTEPVHGCTDTAYYVVVCGTGGTGCTDPTCTCVVGTPSATQNGVYCDNYTFTASTGAGSCTIFTWYFGDGYSGSGTSVTHQYLSPGIYTVYYVASDPGCCGVASTTLTITVPAVANFTPVITCNTVCFTDASVALPADPLSGTGYTWDFGDLSATSNQQNPCHYYSLPGTYSVILEVTTNSGCKAKITKSVTVSGPNAVANVSAATACNQPVTFDASASTSNITAYSWDFGDTYSSNAAIAQHIYSVNTTTTFNWTLIVTDGNGCMDTVIGSITVVPPPAPFPLTYNTPSCGNDTLDAGGGYASYQWYMNGSIIPGATIQTYIATQSGTYTCEVIDANNCKIMSLPANISVLPLPALNVTASPQPLCSNQAITLNSGLTGNYTVIWKDAGYNQIATGFTYSPGILPAGTYAYHVNATDNATTCTDSATITFTVNPAPSVTISNSNPSGICAPNPVTLTATGSPVTVNYLWSSGATTSVLAVYSGGMYTVTVTDPANGCMASATDNVIIFPLPDLSMLPIGCDSSCINPFADTIHGPPGLCNYDWQINGVTVTTLQNLGLNPTNMPVYGIAYTITLIGTTCNGCVDSTKFEYTPHECDTSSSHCYTLTDTIWCNVDGTYSFLLMLQNNNPTATASIMLDNFTVPYQVNGMSYYYQFLNVPANGNSGWFPPTPLILSPPFDQTLPSTFCFHTIVIYGDTCCCDSLCIELPNCDPCDNISVSATSDSTDCCKQISITNNFLGNYFSGVSVVPISLGASIASTTLGGGGGGWSSAGNSSIMSFYPPGNSTIPVGTITDLFTLCLNLQIGAAVPQIVVFNWFVPGSDGTDSVVCTDTLVFNCDPPLQNPCGEIKDSIVCLGDGTYQYTFTVFNYSANPIPTAAIDYMNPQSGVNFPSLVFFFNPAIAPGDSATQTFTFTSSLSPGSVICYHMTLLDSIGCCCHAVDTVCFTLPECDSTCACGSWSLFSANITDPATGAAHYPTIECGTNFTSLTAGVSVLFTGGGYNCTGDSSCTSVLTWNIPGGTPSSGTGLPSFTLNSGGTFTLTMYGYCGGHLCDSCKINFIVDSCQCGHWDLFSFSESTPNSDAQYPNQACGTVYQDVVQNSMISFYSGGFICNGDAATCASDLTWIVTGGASPSSGSGLPTFTLGGAGTYVLTLYGYCGGHLCDSCTFTYVTAADSCTCGSWQPFDITTSNASYSNQACGGTYVSKKGLPITISGSYLCSGGDSCTATYAWTITKGGNFFSSGTGLPITFTPNAVALFVVTIAPVCGGIDCQTCSFTFNVKKLVQAPIQHNPQPIYDGVAMNAAPNPAHDAVMLRFSSSTPEAGIVSWYNELGIAVQQTYVEWNGGEKEVEMNVSALPAGIYFVRFNGDSGSAFVKVTVYR